MRCAYLKHSLTSNYALHEYACAQGEQRAQGEQYEHQSTCLKTKFSFAFLMLAVFAFALSVASFSIFTCVPNQAQADILGSDLIGSTSVSDRSLTVSEVPTLDCTYGILSDADGNIIWSRSSDSKSAIASITKIMTAVVALENADLNTEYTVSSAAASIGESSAGLVQGSSMTLDNLVRALLVHSGNDAAVTIAEGMAGSIDNFVQMMNDKATQLGLTNTHFDNPHGLDSAEHYSCAADICVLSRYAMKNATFREIVSQPSVHVVSASQDDTYESTNVLIQYWNECIGIKTGYTNNAGFCLASSASRNGQELYAVVLGCSNAATRFTDSYKLLTWGFDHYRSIELANSNDVLVDAPVSAYVDKTVKAGVKETVSDYILDYNGDISVDVHLRDLPDGVDEGEEVGVITWRQGEFVITSAPLVAKEKVSKPLPPISIFSATLRLVGVFTGDDCIAQSVLHVQAIPVQRSDNLVGRIDSQLETDVTRKAFEQA